MDVAVDNIVSMLYRTWTKHVISEDHFVLFTEALGVFASVGS